MIRRRIGCSRSVLRYAILAGLVPVLMLTSAGSPDAALAQNISAVTDCSAETPKNAPIAYTNSAGVTFGILGVRVGTDFTRELDLGLVGTDEAWMIVFFGIANGSSDTYNANSDNFHLVVDGEEVREDGFESGDLNDLLGLKDMGNWLGSSIDSGQTEVFAIPYQVPDSGASYALVIDDESDRELDLKPLLTTCAGSAQAPAPTKVAPTVVPNTPVTPTPTTSSSLPLTSGADFETVAIYNTAQQFNGQTVTVRGTVYEIAYLPASDQTAFAITDESSYFFFVFVEGELPAVAKGDDVEITGTLVFNASQEQPSINAETVKKV